MIDELVIHLGDFKTGSTSIQSTFAYKKFTSKKPCTYAASFNHSTLANSFRAGDTQKAWRLAQRIADAFMEAEGGVGVISAEPFEKVDPNDLAALFDGPFKPWRNNFRLIGYLRPHAERFLSSFSERAKKGGFNGGMGKLAQRLEQNGLLHYTPRVQNWAKVFGDHYTVRPFASDRLVGGDVVQDFLEQVFGANEYDYTKLKGQNQTLSLEDLSLMRHIHLTIKSDDNDVSMAKAAFGWNFSLILANFPAPKSTKLCLHKALAQRLQQTYAEDAADLDRLFFGGNLMTDRLRKATEAAVDAPQSLDVTDHYSTEVIRFAEAYAALLKRQMEADPYVFRWSVQPEDRRGKMPELLDL